MIITLTGTPGTGKTSVARELGEKDYQIVDLTEFLKQRSLGQETGSGLEIDIDEMVEALEQEFKSSEQRLVIEGHLAHHFPADYCVVLRCQPDILRERLEQRDYSPEKVQENIESEALDIILQEAVEKQENIVEVDTTDREAVEVAEEVERKTEEGDTSYGEVDWNKYI